jgi:hypothetical protein
MAGFNSIIYGRFWVITEGRWTLGAGTALLAAAQGFAQTATERIIVVSREDRLMTWFILA